MASSPPFTGWLLELPAVTWADRSSVVLALASGVIVGSMLARHGSTALGTVALAVSLLSAAFQVVHWTGSSLHRRRALGRDGDGAWRLGERDGTTAKATLGAATRRIGMTVFLELEVPRGSRRLRLRRWLTPFDVPAPSLRRLAVVLAASGGSARP